MTTIDLPRADVPLVSIVLVTYGGWALTRGALQALREHTDLPFEVVIVDNASPDGTTEGLREGIRGAEVVLNQANVGFGPGANQGADRARGTYLVFLNPDTIVGEGWLTPLVEALEDDPRAGAAVPRYLDPDGSVQEAGGLLFRDGQTMMYGHGQDAALPRLRFRRYVDYGSAACLAVARETFLAAGGFDPVYAPAYCEDVDLLLTLRARGLRTAFEPRSEVTHVRFGSAVDEATRRELSDRHTRILRRRWSDVLAARPPLPGHPTEHHRILAARDADASDRILVVGPAPPQALLLELVGRDPLGRVTFLASQPAPPWDGYEVLLDAGVEVEPFPQDADAWWRERLFHYTAVIAVGPEPVWLRRRLHESQPQASFITGLGDGDVLRELRRVGLLASGSLPGEVLTTIG